MDNMGATLTSETSPNVGNPLNPQPIAPPTTDTIENIVSTPLEPGQTVMEPVGPSTVDGNVQAHFDVNYQAHDVALAAAKATEHGDKSSFQAAPDHHKLDIDDGDDQLEKSKSCCSMLNKLFLALAIVSFALFVCSIAYIIANLGQWNDGRALSKIVSPYAFRDEATPLEPSFKEQYFNLTHPDRNGVIVVLSRLGASVHDVLVPYKDTNGSPQYRSIVVKGGEANHFGSVRFGFDDPNNSMNMVYQLPATYPLLKAYEEEWSMFASADKPNRVRFARNTVQIIYEVSPKNADQFSMTTMVAPSSNEEIVADPTNNIYFNLRGHGNLGTHTLNLSSSDPVNIASGEKIEQDRLMQSQRVDRLVNANNYFYKLNRAGLGKNYVATLSESETRTNMHVFSDHAGVRIDPFGDGIANDEGNHVTTTPELRGVRISPRQSPTYEPSAIYGPTLAVFPSQAIHTTWWQLEYPK